MLISNFKSYFHDVPPSLRRASVSLSAKAGKNWFHPVALVVFTGVLSIGALAQTNSTYVQTNIISDGATVKALVTDPTLINPWGVSVGPAIWIDKAGSGSVAVDTLAGTNAVPLLPSVTIPAAAPAPAQGSPSGTVYNSNNAIFDIPGSTSALFLFGTLDGTIAAWNVNSGTQAVTVVNNSAKASYTDIALDTNATGTFLLAANFRQGTVDVFDSTFAAHALAGSFADPTLPAGYSPFGIHSIGENIYVTYAQVNAATGESVGAGLGYVNEFDNNGNFIARVASQSVLNAPWGMALAPAGFGSFGGDLLIGNFGDGVINAFDPKTFALIGSLNTSAGTPIANIGLWEIFFGQNSGQTTTLGDPNTLYFAAGINGEKGGLFGSIAVAQPAAANFTLQASANSVTVATGQAAGNVTLSLAAANGFTGPVTFSCTPTSVTCTFSQPSVTLSGSGTTSVTVAIAPAAATAAPPTTGSGYNRSSNHPVNLFQSRAGITLAFIGPVGLLAFASLKRKSILARGSLFALLLVVTTAAITGCSSSASPQQSASTTPAAPASTQVTVNAISGAITQSVTVTFTVQ
ncbi:TIGR03118 family protein [Tunturibacter psychrotolerans]|uniref:TIGR03118 family protein n=1 Tax=Tunturiibacter psychrotolerans TaxID=3069686 RepID=A0AAU7ZKE2_9BACT